MRLTAFEKGEKPNPLGPKEKPENKFGYLYKQIRDFPGRVVSVDTAYKRMIRDQARSLEEACMVEQMPRNSKKKRTSILSRWGADYVADLKSDIHYKDVAQKWGVNPSTVHRHRTELGEEVNQGADDNG